MKRFWSLVAGLWAVAAVAQPVRIAAPGLQGVDVPQDVTNFYTEHLAGRLGEHGLQVVTQKEISTLLTLERQQQLMGCEVESCAAELAGALGADAVLMGDVARLQGVTHVQLKVVSARDGRKLGTFRAKVEDDGLVVNALDRAAHVLAGEAYAGLKRAPPPTFFPPAGGIDGTYVVRAGPRKYAWAPAALGALGAGAGTVFWLQARTKHDRLGAQAGSPLGPTETEALRQDGQRAQTLSRVGFAVAGAGAVGAGLMYLLGGPRTSVQPSVGVVGGRSGASAALGVQGVLP